jgi:anti-anti-sigma factor
VDPQLVRIVVKGELDLADERPFVDDVNAVFAGDERVTVELDLSEVEFIDSSGVRALLVLRRAHSDRLMVGRRSDAVQRVLGITGLTDLFSEAGDGR